MKAKTREQIGSYVLDMKPHVSALGEALANAESCAAPEDLIVCLGEMDLYLTMLLNKVSKARKLAGMK